jgi:hypothetical protein
MKKQVTQKHLYLSTQYALTLERNNIRIYYNHRIPVGTKCFLLSQTSGPALGPTYTYSLIQRVPKELSLAGP